MTLAVIRNNTRQHLIQLMLYAMEQPAPNLAHFLLGFQLRVPIHKSELQDPGMLVLFYILLSNFIRFIDYLII